MERGHGGVVIGSEMSGSVTDVTVTACDFRRTDRGLRIKTRRGRGGEVARVAVSRLHDGRRRHRLRGKRLLLLRCGRPVGSGAVARTRPPVDATDAAHPRHRRSATSTLSGIRLAAGVFLGLPEAPITGLTLGGIRASFDPDGRGRRSR